MNLPRRIGSGPDPERKQDPRQYQADKLREKGKALEKKDDLGAYRAYQQVLKLYQELNHVFEQAMMWESMGEATWRLENYPLAEQCFESAFASYESVEAYPLHRNVLDARVELAFEQNKFETALSLNEQLIAMTQANRHATDMVIRLQAILKHGMIEEKLNHPVQARQFYALALSAHPELLSRLKPLEVNIMRAWGAFEYRLGFKQDGCALYQLALLSAEAYDEIRPNRETPEEDLRYKTRFIEIRAEFAAMICDDGS